MGKYLGDQARQQAIELYLNALPETEREQLQSDYFELTEKTNEIADRLEDLLSQIQALAGESPAERTLLYSLLKQLPVIVFEPLNYAFVGRVVIPLENVFDLLLNLDIYRSRTPVRRGESPGIVELVSVSEQGEPGDIGPAHSVIDVSGIGPYYSAILREYAEVRTIEDLLGQGDTIQQRIALSEKTGLSEKLLTKWVRRADLMRIDGVGEEYGELLEQAGIRSMADLARRNADGLYERLRATNDKQRLVQIAPSIHEVQEWIVQARRWDSRALNSR